MLRYRVRRLLCFRIQRLGELRLRIAVNLHETGATADRAFQRGQLGRAITTIA